MNKLPLPLTNKNKFKRLNDKNLFLKDTNERKECFWVTSDMNMTIHFSYANKEAIWEGIVIEWLGNPFRLSSSLDNYVMFCDE